MPAKARKMHAARPAIRPTDLLDIGPPAEGQPGRSSGLARQRGGVSRAARDRLGCARSVRPRARRWGAGTKISVSLLGPPRGRVVPYYGASPLFQWRFAFANPEQRGNIWLEVSTTPSRSPRRRSSCSTAATRRGRAARSYQWPNAPAVLVRPERQLRRPAADRRLQRALERLLLARPLRARGRGQEDLEPDRDDPARRAGRHEAAGRGRRRGSAAYGAPDRFFYYRLRQLGCDPHRARALRRRAPSSTARATTGIRERIRTSATSTSSCRPRSRPAATAGASPCTTTRATDATELRALHHHRLRPAPRGRRLAERAGEGLDQLAHLGLFLAAPSRRGWPGSRRSAPRSIFARRRLARGRQPLGARGSTSAWPRSSASISRARPCSPSRPASAPSSGAGSSVDPQQEPRGGRVELHAGAFRQVLVDEWRFCLRARSLSRVSSSSSEVASAGRAKVSPSPWSATVSRSGRSCEEPGEDEPEHRDRRRRSGRSAGSRRRTPAMYGSWIARRQRVDLARAEVGRQLRRAPAAAACRRGSTASWFAKIAPKIGTPIVPPIERKRVAVEVATPRLRVLDGVLHREDEHLHHEPEAEPEDGHVQVGGELCSSRRRGGRAGRARATVSAVPMIGKTL